MSQYTELEELEAFLATQELLAFESVDISECLGEEFHKSARFQKLTTVNEIEQSKKQNSKENSTTYRVVVVYRAWDEYRNTQIETLGDGNRSVPVYLGTIPVEEVNYWLTRFILEVMRGNGRPHPYPWSIYSLICSI